MGRGSEHTIRRGVMRRGQVLEPGILNIDTATDADVRPLRVLKRTFAERELKPMHGLKATKEWMRLNCNQKVLREQMEEGKQQFIIARDDNNTIVGLAAVQHDEQYMEISGLYLLEPNEKVAGQLADHLEQQAKKEGYQRARVPVLRSDENIRKFVQDRGFVGTGSGERDPVFGVIVDYYEKTL